MGAVNYNRCHFESKNIVRNNDMGTKNNPENRGKTTEARKHAGKDTKPVKYINGSSRYMAAQYENGELVLDPQTKEPIPYKNLEKPAA